MTVPDPGTVPHPADGRVVRLAKDHWDDPCDPTFADRRGGRWNRPGDGPTLYLCDDQEAARANVVRLHTGGRVEFDDLRDDAPYVLVPVTLPGDAGFVGLRDAAALAEVGLPAGFPVDDDGVEAPHGPCQCVGASLREGCDGLLVRSAASADGHLDETVWFPASADERPTRVGEPVPFAEWRYG